MPLTNMRSLDTIGLGYGVDKASNVHNFLNIYEPRLANLRSRLFTMYEIGVASGASLAMWSEYFPQAVIVGLDVDEKCLAHQSNNVKVRIGDATQVKFLFNLLVEFGSPELVIDDGSHRWDHQITSFQTLFPCMPPGAYYIIENIDTSFDGYLQTAPFQGYSPISCFDYLYKLARLVSGDSALQAEKPYDLFIASYYPQIESIEFCRRTALIRKRVRLISSPGEL